MQNGQKMAFWGAELQSSKKKMRKSTQGPNSISCRKETALKEINHILEKLQDLKKSQKFFPYHSLGTTRLFYYVFFLLLALHLKGNVEQ